VNAFAYQREGTVPAGAAQDSVESVESGDAMAAQFDEIARHPGRLTGRSIELPPGENDVLACIELILEDGARVEDALEELERQLALTSAASFTVGLADRGALRCCMSRELESQDERRAALEPLGRALLAAHAATPPDPLVIIREQTSDLALYRLAPLTRERLEKVHHVGWHFAPLRVRDEDALALEATRRSLLPHIAEVVTGLPRRSIEGMGGLQMVTSDGEVLLAWPAAEWTPSSG
jgi:hypothetical protein